MKYDILNVNKENGKMCDKEKEDEKCVGGMNYIKDLMDKNEKVNKRIRINDGKKMGGDLLRKMKLEKDIREMKLIKLSEMEVEKRVFKYGGDEGRM
jgi:hypothetical protein